MEEVILVDENDNQVGTGEKIETHKKGILHRAFSIYIFNEKNQLLLQRRADGKYHSPGLLSNTCCGHPRPGEKTDEAAHRRLREEMGFDCPFSEKTSFIYKVKFDNDLTEHEYLHVFTGTCDPEIKLNSEEASEHKWIPLEELKKDVENNPDEYTYWTNITLPHL